MEDRRRRIGANIKTLRVQSDMPQKHLAAYLKVDQSQISKIENGERSIKAVMLEKIATLFGLPVTSLLSEDLPTDRMGLSLRAEEITREGLDAISTVHRIALNLAFMYELSEGQSLDEGY